MSAVREPLDFRVMTSQPSLHIMLTHPHAEHSKHIIESMQSYQSSGNLFTPLHGGEKKNLDRGGRVGACASGRR